jgi:EAL domain-containing protein (putative c-di-GMP-specific phosphodiesterase class I)
VNLERTPSMQKQPSSPRVPVARATNQFQATPFATDKRKVRDSMTSLQRFVRAEDLAVVFQPIVHFDTLKVFAYEALVRCNVPEFNYPPALFERAAADQCTGRLGRMIREVAIPLCSGKPLFLNVHPLELQERWLVRPDDPMFFHDHDVYLEITESVPMTHFELCYDVLTDVRTRGNVQLVVDDLGAGYSNLKRIADLEPAVVKLDRGLIAGVTPGSRQQRLVAGVVKICNDLDARVVAEGIETVEEYEALRELGIHYGQGYLFAKPGFPLPVVDSAIIRRR